MLRFDKATDLSLVFKFILPERLSNRLWGQDVSLFLKFINIVFLLVYNFIEFIMLLYTLLVISFAQYKEYIICLISFSNYLLWFVQVPLIIFEAFVSDLIFWMVRDLHYASYLTAGYACWHTWNSFSINSFCI